MLDIIFSPLLKLTPLISVFLFSTFILFIINVFQKILVDQEKIKEIKENLNKLNEQMKQEQKDKNQKKVSSLFKEVMAENNKMMGMTIKPMFISLILVIILLPFLSSNFGDIETSTNEVNIDGTIYNIDKNGNELKINKINCEIPCSEKIGNSIWEITSVNEKVKFSRTIALLPISLPFVGNDLGWLGWYFVSSIPIAILIRKLLKINM